MGSRPSVDCKLALGCGLLAVGSGLSVGWLRSVVCLLAVGCLWAVGCRLSVGCRLAVGGCRLVDTNNCFVKVECKYRGSGERRLCEVCYKYRYLFCIKEGKATSPDPLSSLLQDLVF